MKALQVVIVCLLVVEAVTSFMLRHFSRGLDDVLILGLYLTAVREAGRADRLAGELAAYRNVVRRLRSSP